MTDRPIKTAHESVGGEMQAGGRTFRPVARVAVWQLPARGAGRAAGALAHVVPVAVDVTHADGSVERVAVRDASADAAKGMLAAAAAVGLLGLALTLLLAIARRRGKVASAEGD